MNKANSIIWFEWFNKEKESVFEQETKTIWGLALRNGIAPTIFKKWLREEICKDIESDIFDEEDIRLIEEIWANQKKISTEKFAENRVEILDKCKMSEKNFQIYTENELKAIRWAENNWSNATEQIYLETKDQYDEVKLKMITLPVIEKGLTLEIYQQLKENEVDFVEAYKQHSSIKLQSEPDGTWYKKSSLRKELFQALIRLKQGEISAPFKISDKYTIIKLCEIRGNELTIDIRKRIITEQMNSFIDYGVEQLLDHACMRTEGKRQ